jgi:ribosomal-protein-alanine N-acetyltransferase
MLNTELGTTRLILQPMQPRHAPLLADYFRRNEEHFRRWDPPRPRGIADAAFWEAEVRRAVQEADAGTVMRWVMFRADDTARVVGRINFTQLVRGPFQSCMLGYAIDRADEGHGLMTEALQAALAHAFDVLRLHRVQANHLPENARSARLLQRLGFRVEGMARDYLYIDGAWRDHVLNALVNPRFDASIFAST